MKQMANRHMLTLNNRRTSYNFTDFCNFDSKVWKSCKDTVRSDSFLPYQKVARSFCPPGNLQTQRNHLGYSTSYNPPRALVKLHNNITNVNAGREFQIRGHVTLQVRQYCNGACAMPEELQSSTDYAVATEDCTWMVRIPAPLASRRAPTVEFTSSSLCLPRTPGAWVSARTVRWWKTDGHFMQVNNCVPGLSFSDAVWQYYLPALTYNED
jgi:hypothetical protein